jgi:GTP-binding protein
MTDTKLNITQAEFVISAPNLKLCPEPTLPEIAIAGRSNVGKSSLINLVCGRKNLAKISSTPGKTRLINYFKLTIAPDHVDLHLIDLPGYGYAKVSKSLKADWDKALGDFLEMRTSLSGIIHLIDARHAPSKHDLQMREWIVHTGLPCITVMTKMDKLKKNERNKNKAMIRKALQLRHDDACVETSVLNREGVQELLQALVILLSSRQSEE